MHPPSTRPPDDLVIPGALAKVAQQYRDEGYAVVERPRGDQLPPFLAGSRPDLVASRGPESVAVEIKADRGDLASDAGLPRMAEVVNAQPGWRLDVIILGAENVIAKATRGAAEPTDDQLAQILRSAEELADSGHAPSAQVAAGAALRPR